jgi:hypothetical protein
MRASTSKVVSAAAPPRRTNVADLEPLFGKALQPAMEPMFEKPAELRGTMNQSQSYTKQIDTPLNSRAACRLEQTLAAEETRRRQNP